MGKYNIIYSLEKNLYLKNAPIVIDTGVLVHNTESDKLHIQLKFKNLQDKPITMLTVKFLFMDAVGREIYKGEKQYIDLKAKLSETFGDREAVYLKNNTVRKFSVVVTEVCFADGTILSLNENAEWKALPKPLPLSEKFTSKEARDEFKILYGNGTQFVPLRYTDIWFCTCGNINKLNQEKCSSCGAELADMEQAGNKELEKDNIYRTATILVKGKTSSDIKKGIALFESIIEWKDSENQIKQSKQKLKATIKSEKAEQEKKAKQKKKVVIISSISCAVIAVFVSAFLIVSSVLKSNKYQQAKEYYDQNKYGEAMELFDELDGYKDADDLYTYSKYMNNGEYGKLVKKFGLTEFVIPDGVKEIKDYTFSYCDNLTSVTIPDSVTSIGSSAFEGCSSLTSITIPNAVTSIGDSAFYGCDSLTIITLPNSVTSIRDSAFEGCSSLTSITIPNAVTSIGSFAFEGCSSLTSITIPNAVTFIDKYAFKGCIGLTSVTIPDGVTSIGYQAFCNCSSLTSVTIPDSVTSIGNYAFDGCKIVTATIPTLAISAIKNDSLKTVILTSGNSIDRNAFYNCTNLTSVTIPDSVTSIGDYVFEKCSALTSVTIGNSVTSIGSSAFSGCTSLTSVYVTDLSSWCKIKFSDEESNPLSYAQKLYLNNELVTSLVIPNNVTFISDSAFRGCTSLTSITMPDSVTSIGKYAFRGCTGLTSVTIPDGVISIGYQAFCNCSSLTSVTIPDSVTSIGNYAFDGCKIVTATIPTLAISAIVNDNLKTVNITSGDSIGYQAFCNCSSLTSVTIPDSVTSIGNYAFDDCPIEIATIPTLAISAIVNDNLKAVNITSGNSIDDSAFRGCKSLTNVTISNSVTSIGSSAFYGCSSLTNINIPNSVTSIGESVFEGCNSLNYNEYSNALYLGNDVNPYLCLIKAKDVSKTSYDINSNTRIIYINAFVGCNNLKSVTIPNSISTLYKNSFSGCPIETATIPAFAVPAIKNNNLKTVNITSGNKIPDSAFYGCSSLTSITIPNSVTSIGNSAFRGCAGLASITIPNSVTSIGDYAFYDCNSLTSVKFENTSGWQVELLYSTSNISSSDLSNTATAAKYLVSNYFMHTWKRS